MHMAFFVIVLAAAGAEEKLAPAAEETRRMHQMVLIPAGEFLMGTSPEETESLAKQYGVHPTHFLTESPQRKVDVEAFAMDRFPVTNAQYKRFVDATGHRPPLYWEGRNFPDGMADHPVVWVNWHDADAYARWVGLRLPTEAEWEKAARGTDGRQYPWGNQWQPEAVRLEEPLQPRAQLLTHPVGAYSAGASVYGVLDLCGNVAEWTSTTSQAPDPERQWAWYVIKGAGLPLREKYNYRCAARNFSAHTSRMHPWLGFRCAGPAQLGKPAEALPPLQAKAGPIPAVEGPRTELMGKEPIRVEGIQGAHFAQIFVPAFPEGHFGMNVPEQVQAEDLALGWSMPHEGIRWTKQENGTAEYTCRFPGKAELRVRLEPGADVVVLRLELKNLTDKPWRRVFTNTCLNNHPSPYFVDPERVRSFVWTDDGPTSMLRMPIAPRSGEPLHGGWGVAAPNQKAPAGGPLIRYPFLFVRSRDGQWIVAHTTGEGTGVGSNAHYSCLHANPAWPEIPPGQSRSVVSRLYFLRRGPEDLLVRWKKDFGK